MQNLALFYACIYRSKHWLHQLLKQENLLDLQAVPKALDSPFKSIVPNYSDFVAKTTNIFIQ